MSNKMKVEKIELNRGQISRQLLKGSEITGLCRKLARDMQSRAGEGYETDVFQGRNRINASVGAATTEAYQDNLDNNTLLKAMR